MRPPIPPVFYREDSTKARVPHAFNDQPGQSMKEAGRSRLSHSSHGYREVPVSNVQRRLFSPLDDRSPGELERDTCQTPPMPPRRKTDTGHVVDQATDESMPRGSPVSMTPAAHEMPPRRLSMPGDLGQAPSFSFPAMTPTSMTMSGAIPQPRVPSRIQPTSSAPVSGYNLASGAFSSPHSHGSPYGYYGPSPRPLSRASTPLPSGFPTPRSSLNGSVYGSPSEYGMDMSTGDRRTRRMLSGVEKGLDTPVWVSRLRLVGRLLLAALFANMLCQELREWFVMRGYGWREWYDMSWVSEEMPPLPPLLSLVALVLLVGGWSSSLAATYLAARLLLQTLELWEDMIAVVKQQTSNLLPVKELAVVGTVIVFIGHTYYVPEWLRGAKRARGKATGLLYTQRWRPGQFLIILLGKLLVAPLFISICALQYFDITSRSGGLSGWAQRLLHPYYWLPSGDSSTNNWMPLQAVSYMLLLTNISNKRVPALLAALLVAEGLTCWRFWSSVWMSKHYVWYLRRHFCANVAIAGGLLLNLPEGRHDAGAVRQEGSVLGKKRT